MDWSLHSNQKSSALLLPFGKELKSLAGQSCSWSRRRFMSSSFQWSRCWVEKILISLRRSPWLKFRSLLSDYPALEKKLLSFQGTGINNDTELCYKPVQLYSVKQQSDLRTCLRAPYRMPSLTHKWTVKLMKTTTHPLTFCVDFTAIINSWTVYPCTSAGNR